MDKGIILGMDETNKTYKKRYDWLKPHQFKKGGEGGPGRPKGQSLKEFAREFLMNLPDEDKIDYLSCMPEDLVWKMAEGMPETKTDITSGGKPIPIYGGQSVDIQGYNSNEKDIPAQETN